MSGQTLHFLNKKNIEAIDPHAFQQRSPYPWWNPQGILTEAGYQQLLDNMLPVERFSEQFNKQRKHGQISHDRYVLKYRPNMLLPEVWRAFIDELNSEYYRNFICNLFNVTAMQLAFQWHYTPNGCSVSPHCDAEAKFGSHIFYLNTAKDWDPTWGGETLILDDEGRFPAKSNPQFADFNISYTAEIADNRSLLFGRRGNSWHGVKPITCPAGAMRKTFIVIARKNKTD